MYKNNRLDFSEKERLVEHPQLPFVQKIVLVFSLLMMDSSVLFLCPRGEEAGWRDFFFLGLSFVMTLIVVRTVLRVKEAIAWWLCVFAIASFYFVAWIFLPLFSV